MKKQILIIEDDHEIRSSLLEVLEEEGYSVLSAENGQQGIEVLEASETMPSLIILDLMMPVLDGYGFRRAQSAHEHYSTIPTAVFSAGYTSPDADIVRFEESIRKPVDLDDLFALVKKYCD